MVVVFNVLIVRFKKHFMILLIKLIPCDVAFLLVAIDRVADNDKAGLFILARLRKEEYLSINKASCMFRVVVLWLEIGQVVIIDATAWATHRIRWLPKVLVILFLLIALILLSIPILLYVLWFLFIQHVLVPLRPEQLLLKYDITFMRPKDLET